MKCIIGRYVWLLAVGCWLLAACSSDGTDEQRTGSPLQVTPYIAAYQNHDALSRRAVSAGYAKYDPASDLAIGLFVLPEDPTSEDFVAKLIRYNNGTWHSQIMVESANYTICGYMPKLNSIESSITQAGDNNLELQLSIPAVIADDVCFVTGIKDGKDDDAGDLLQGNFTYVGNNDNNDICLLMDHLFTSVKFNFSVDADYSALRTIKLKEMTLSTTKEKVDAVIKLTKTNGTDPVTEITYTSAGNSSSATFFEDAAGIDIKDDAVTIRDNYSCCFAPGLSSALTLVCTYDVYDSKGNLIRKDCEATNKLPNLDAVRGECWTINLNVAPTYLYQLSEPDLDNPTITIN